MLPILLILAAPLPVQAPAFDPPSPLRPAIERYTQDRAALRRLHGLQGSPARRVRLGELQERWRAQLAAYDFEHLSRDGQVDWLLLGDLLAYQDRALELEEQRWEEMRGLMPFAETIFQLEAERRAMGEVEPESAAQLLQELAEQARAASEDLSLEEPSKEQASQRPSAAVGRRAASAVGSLRRELGEWHRFHDGYHPMYTWWCAEPFAEANQALEEYAAELRLQLVGEDEEGEEPIVGDPIGREALLAELRRERIAYEPAQLVELAQDELAWCTERLLEATDELGFGTDWRAALEQVKDQHLPPGQQPQLVRTLAEEATDFVTSRELVTVPALCQEIWRMQMMSPERQRYTPYFTGGEVVSISFPTGEMTHAEKRMSLRSNNVPFSRATVHHELIPGHHLQGYMSDRHRRWRAPFRTPFLVEGWALYWEFRLWDLGFPRDAADEIGMLFWRMHRCARVVLSLGFHLGELEPQEMIDFLVEHVGHEQSAASAEVRRWVQGGYGPLYQCAYLIGGLQLKSLHAELVGSGRMQEREFHDAVLRENAIPVELIRAALMPELDLDPEAAPGWRF